jgi:hypothetical protein
MILVSHTIHTFYPVKPLAWDFIPCKSVMPMPVPFRSRFLPFLSPDKKEMYA